MTWLSRKIPSLALENITNYGIQDVIMPDTNPICLSITTIMHYDLCFKCLYETHEVARNEHMSAVPQQPAIYFWYPVTNARTTMYLCSSCQPRVFPGISIGSSGSTE